MNLLLLFIILILIFIIHFYYNGSNFKRITLNTYLIFWMVLFIISISNPFGLYKVSNSIYFLLLLTIVSFVFGFLVFDKKPKRYLDDKKSYIKINDNLKKNYIKIKNSKGFIFILFIAVFILFVANQRYKLVIANDITQARNAVFFTGEIFSTFVEQIAFYWFIGPCTIFALFFICYSIIVGSYFNIALFLSILVVFLKSSFGSGRLVLIDLGIMIVYSLLISKYLRGNIKENKKILKKNFLFRLL